MAERKKTENKKAQSPKTETKEEKPLSRKRFLRNMIMGGGLTLGYGTFAWYVLRYLSPPKRTIKRRKIFIANKGEVPPGATLDFSSPEGEKYLLTNRQTDEGYQYFAFSSRCPHLGCKVLWRPKENEFFCPCHDGKFDASGVATAGPPLKAKQRLKEVEIQVIDQAIYAITERM